MNGTIIGKFPYNRGIIVSVSEITNKKQAQKIVGRKAVIYDMKKRKHEGRVVGIHGTSGNIIIKFKIELPLGTLGKHIEIF